MKEFGRGTKGIDILLMCHNFFGRFDSARAETAFKGPEIWKRTIFVLAQANRLPPVVKDADDRQQKLEDIKKDMQHKCLEVLSRDVPRDVVNGIPFVPVGDYKEGSRYSSLELETTKNWMQDLTFA